MGYRVVALSSSGAKKDLAQKLGSHIYIDGSQVNQIQALKELPDAEHDLSVSGTIGERPVITVRSRPLWG